MVHSPHTFQTMNAPATSQFPPRARPSSLALPLPRSARVSPAHVPGFPSALAHPGHAPRPSLRTTSALPEVAAGAALLVLWAWLWTTLLTGVVSPAAQLRATAQPAAAASAR